MITLLIGYESFARILSAVSIHFAEAIPIAFLGLAVNVAGAWLLADGDYHHGHPVIAWRRKDMIMMSTPHHDTRRRSNFGDL
jgi:Co/Zn/Cd efflux system component